MRSMKHAILSVLFALVTSFFMFTGSASAAGENTLWTELGIYGGQITAVEVDPFDPSVLYAGSWMGDGLFKSTDHGRTWQTIGWFRNREVWDIALDPYNPGTLWVANGARVDVSHDGGNTFRTFFMPDRRFCYALAVDPHDPSGETVYAGLGGINYSDSGGIIYMTRDGGETWFDMGFTFDLNVRDVQINPSREGEIWAISNEYQVTRKGFVYLIPPDSDTYFIWEFDHFVDSLLIHPVFPDLVYVAAQFGIRYTIEAEVPTLSWSIYDETYFARSLCIPPTATDVIYSGFIVDADTIIAASHDYGESWYNIGDAPDEFICMTADPLDASVLYAGGINSGVFKSVDSARNWSTSNTGIKANTVYATDILKGPSPSIVCGTLSGIFLSKDGSDWNKINTRMSYFVLFSPESQDTVYAGQTRYVAKTVNGGAGWSYRTVSDRTVSHNVQSIAIDGRDPSTIYAALSFRSGPSRGELIRLVEDGEYFSDSSLSILYETPAPLNTVLTDSRSPDRILIGSGSFYAPASSGSIYRSTDRGSTWKEVLSGATVNRLTADPSNPDILYAACGASNTSYSGIYKSTDGGESWFLIINGLPDMFSVTDIKVDPENSQVLFASLYKGENNDMLDDLNGVYVSLNGGDYWSQIGLSDYRMHDVNVYPDFGGHYASRAVSVNNASVFVPGNSTVVAGTASGLYSAKTAGTGIIYGNVVSDHTGDVIDRALISSQLGANTITDRGIFVMLVPAGVHTLNVQAADYQGASLAGITVGAGGSISVDIKLRPSGGDDPCLFSEMLPQTSQKPMLDFLRTFRDAYLYKNRSGARMISFYYENGRSLWEVMQTNPVLLRQGLGLMYQGVPALKKLLSDDSYTRPVSLRNKADGFLYNIQQQSSDDAFIKNIDRLRKGLRDNNIRADSGSR